MVTILKTEVFLHFLQLSIHTRHCKSENNNFNLTTASSTNLAIKGVLKAEKNLRQLT